jgi:hypothetical protein
MTAESKLSPAVHPLQHKCEIIFNLGPDETISKWRRARQRRQKNNAATFIANNYS